MSIGQSIYFHNGQTGARFAAPSRLVWALNKKLNRAGQSQFYVPYGAPELDMFGEDFVLPGTLVYAEDLDMGTYSGVLMGDREWDEEGITVDVMSAEYLAFFRTTPDSRVVMNDVPSGAIFSQLVEWMNQEVNSLVKPGDVALSGPHIQRTFSGSNIYNEICDLSDATGYDWEFEPVLEGTDLYFRANWYERRGRDLTGRALKDGINTDRSKTRLRETEPIVNQVHAVGMQSASGGEAPRRVANNAVSQARYGLRQGSLSSNASEPSTVEAEAQQYVSEHGDPAQQFSTEVVDRDGILAHLRLGDFVTFSSPKYGFNGKRRGTLRTVRVTGTTLFAQAASVKRMPVEVITV